MAIGRSGAAQNDLMAKWPEMPQSRGTCSAIARWTCFGKPGLPPSGGGMQTVLRAANGAPSLPSGRYFRMHMIG
jgi:hypothetical protein